MTNIMQSWPMPDVTPRRVQLQALSWIEECLNNKVKNLILEAPVGSGKSFIGITTSRYLSNNGKGSSYIMTPQKILQRQYIDEFSGHHVVSYFGKGNYNCSNKGLPCDIADLLSPSCGAKCAARVARQMAMSCPNTVFNYKLALLSFLSPKWARRRLMILDECHALEDYLVDHAALAINSGRAKKLGVIWVRPGNIFQVQSWIANQYDPMLRSKIAELEKICDDLARVDITELKLEDIRAFRELKSYLEHAEVVDMYSTMNPDKLNEDYVLVSDDDSFQIKYVYGRDNFNSILKPRADHFLFMSSTIFDKNAYCSDLGLDPKETEFLSLDSEFPKKNRPVYYAPAMKMNYDWKNPNRETGRKKMLESIKQIMATFPNDTGIIHSGNFVISEWLRQELTNNSTHKIFHHNTGHGLDRNNVIADFVKYDSPSILISPSITEGLDLKEDRARFAIFVKIPFPNLKDAWVSKRMNLSDIWYSRKTFTMIIQGGGRVVRSPTDWGACFILDESFGYLEYKFNNKIPRWWKEALIKQR